VDRVELRELGVNDLDRDRVTAIDVLAAPDFAEAARADFTTTTGLRRDNRRATRLNLRGLPMVSR